MDTRRQIDSFSIAAENHYTYLARSFHAELNYQACIRCEADQNSVLEFSYSGATIDSWKILARANFSLTLEQLLVVILVLSLTTLIVAGVIVQKGFWPVLLIATNQVLLVAMALFRAWLDAWALENIEYTGTSILITRRTAGRTDCFQSDARWTKVRLEKSRTNWYAPRLSLYSLGTEVELGQFLAAGERQRLVVRLNQMLMACCAWKLPETAIE